MRTCLFMLLLQFSVCATVQARVEASDYSSFWLWAGVKPQSVLATADSVYILQGQISEKANQTVFVPQGISVPRLKTPVVWLAYRVESLHWSPAILQQINQQIARWKQASNRVYGIQIDFDAQTLRLNEYTSFLKTLRQQLPADVHLSITGLLDWSSNSTPEDLGGLKDVVDEVVIQTYQGKRTIPTYPHYLAKLQRLTLPFKLGLVQQGEWQAPAWVAQHPNFMGYVIFLVND